MIHTRFCDVLGITHPIINAPMAGAATAELAAAVSAAGGLGMIGATMSDGPGWLREQSRQVRARTDRPFGVGFVSSAPDTAELLAVAIAERVPAISHSFADPTPYVAPTRGGDQSAGPGTEYGPGGGGSTGGSGKRCAERQATRHGRCPGSIAGWSLAAAIFVCPPGQVHCP